MAKSVSRKICNEFWKLYQSKCDDLWEEIDYEGDSFLLYPLSMSCVADSMVKSAIMVFGSMQEE